MSRFLVFSDMHFHYWKYGAHVDDVTGNSRLTDQLKMFIVLCQYANNEGIKNILFCGDFFHTPGKIRTDVLQNTHNTISSMQEAFDLNFVWLVGNHDQADKSGNVHALDFLDKFGYVAGVPRTFELPDMPTIYALPYTEDEVYLDKMLGNVTDNSILMMHQGIAGVEVNSKGFTLDETLHADMIPDNITHAFVGHYHTFKRVRDHITIPGAPVQHNWGDKGEERGFLDVTIDSGNCVHLKRVPLPGIKFIELKYDELVSDHINYKILIKNYHEDSLLRITGCPKNSIVSELRTSLDPHFSHVEIHFENETPVVSPQSEFTTVDDLFNEFVSTNKISGRRLKVGNSIRAGKYRENSKVKVP